MTTLYELSAQFKELSSMMDDPNIPLDALVTSMTEVADGITEKSTSISRLILNTKADVKALKEEEDRLARRRKSMEKKIEWLENYLMVIMQSLYTNHIKVGGMNVKIKDNPPTVIIDNEDAIPDIYTMPVVGRKIYKTEILKDILKGMEVPGAHLETGKRLEIR
jgi:hypothetical protein